MFFTTKFPHDRERERGTIMGRSPCINGKYNKPHQGLLSVQYLGIPYSVKHGRLSERGRLVKNSPSQTTHAYS